MTKNLRNSAILAVAAVMTISGCASKENTEQSNQKIIELQKQLDIKNTKISELENENSKRIPLIPQNAKAGECYAKVLVPEEYETKDVRQLVKEAETQIKIVPETYKMVDKKVTIREESTKLITVPATYKTLTETIMIEPERTEITTIPATYKNISEQILIKPSYTTWKKGRGEIEKIDNATDEIMCLVEVPAVYDTITKQVIDTPATTKEVKTPAVYKTIVRTVVDTPATTKEVVIPAICKMVSTRVLDTNTEEVKTELPAIYTMVPTKVKISDSYFKWQSILCETNTTQELISNLQKSLKDKNYNITDTTGVYNDETKAAVKAYQKDNNLNYGALTIETLKSLGL